MPRKRMQLDDAWLLERARDDKSPSLFLDEYNKAHGTEIRYGTFYEYLRVKDIPFQRKDIAYNDEWIEKNFDNYASNKDMWIDYCKLFGDVSFNTFSSHCVRKLKKNSNCWWEDDEIAFLKENYPKLGINKTVELYHKTFTKKRGFNSILDGARRLGLHVNEDVLENNRAWQRRKNGTVTLHDRNGYYRIRTEKGWGYKHRYEYEKAYGSIPKGMSVMFLNNDKDDFSPENLYAVPNKFLAPLQTNGFRSTNRDVTITGIKWCELYMTLKENNKYMEVI